MKRRRPPDGPDNPRPMEDVLREAMMETEPDLSPAASVTIIRVDGSLHCPACGAELALVRREPPPSTLELVTERMEDLNPAVPCLGGSVQGNEGERKLVSAIFGRPVPVVLDGGAVAVERSLRTLAGREAQVVRMRFGLPHGRHPMTIKAIGEQLGLSRSRIGQIQARALRKLRHPTRSRPLIQWIVFGPREDDDEQGRPRSRPGAPRKA